MAGSRPGPAPKRAEERNRRNVPATGEAVAYGSDQFGELPFDVELLVEPPAADESWHKIAIMLYEAIMRDPARVWMGPADWAMTYLMCENVHREMSPQVIGIVDGGYDPETGERVAGHVARDVVPMKGTSIAALLKWTNGIGLSEGARLALRKEVTFNAAPKIDTHEPSEDEVASTREGFFSVEGGKA